MALQIEEVQAWLLELHQVEAAALLSEAEFEYRWIDVGFRGEFEEIEIVELDVRLPPRIYRAIGGDLKEYADQLKVLFPSFLHTQQARTYGQRRG
jgi:hypothetical protein